METGTAGSPDGLLDDLFAALPGRVVTDPEIMLGLSADQAVWAPVGSASPWCGRHRRTTSAQSSRSATTPRAGRGTRRRDRPVRWGQRRGRLCRDLAGRHGPDHRGRPVGAARRGAAGCRQRRPPQRVAEHGLWYPPDPASSPWSTIGGNVATNAGGMCCVKYGVTRDYVLELEMVTGTGEVVRIGRRHRQGRGRLRPRRAGRRVGGHARHRHRGDRPPPPTAGRRRSPSPGHFPSVDAAGNAVRDVGEAGTGRRPPSSSSTGTASRPSTRGRTWVSRSTPTRCSSRASTSRPRRGASSPTGSSSASARPERLGRPVDRS